MQERSNTHVAADHAPFLENAFSLDPSEQSYVIDDIEGEIPAFIQGRYYLNGPARFQRGDFRYRHWLDGDGMVCSLEFANHLVHFANRFVRSAKFTAETEANEPLFRTFGTRFPDDRLKRGIALESPVNVSVYPFSDTLLAFGEQGLPWELDPVTLDTRGVYTFGGRLNDVSPFSAHPKWDAATGEMFNFGIAFSATNPQLHIYGFDASGSLRYRKRQPLDYACSIHDCALSPSYLVLYLSPYILDMDAMREEGRALMESLRWEPQRGSQLLLISRHTGDAVASLPIGQGYCLHLINAFETDGHVIIDVVEYDQPVYDQYEVLPDMFTAVREARPVRFVVDPHTPECLERQALASLLTPDFPTLNPAQAAQPYQDFWILSMGAPPCAGRKFFNQLLRLGWDGETAGDHYQTPAHCYLGGEPLFLSNPDDSRNGAIICQIFDAKQRSSAFALFDAYHVAKGPIAVLHLREPIPLLFHASFRRAPDTTERSRGRRKV